MGDPGSAVLRAAGVSMSMREHGGLASLALVGAGQRHREEEDQEGAKKEAWSVAGIEG